MKYISIFFQFLVFYSFFFISGCKEKHDEIPIKKLDTIYITSIMKKYSVFKPGSYWIYKNEISGSIDSNFITSTRSSYDKIKSDTVIESFTSYHRGDFIQNLTCEANQCWLMTSGSYTGPFLINDNFHDNFIDSLNDYQIFKNVKMFDTLIINGKTYLNVLNTQYSDYSFNLFEYELTFYLGESIGIIKYREKTNGHDSTWSLLRYNITN